MAKLSPTAQAVWDAAWQLSPVNCESHEDRRRQQIAAALRVAAAHLPNSAMYPSSDWGRGWRTGINDTRQGLLAIAAELDGTGNRTGSWWPKAMSRPSMTDQHPITPPPELVQ